MKCTMHDAHGGRRRAPLVIAGMLAAIAALAGAGSALQASEEAVEGGAPFSIDWSTVDGGGGTSDAADIQLFGVIGQPDAGTLSAGSFEWRGGFLAAGTTTPPPCPADVNGDGTVGFDDLLGVLSAWGDCLDCPADLTGDGVVGFDDLLGVLSAWGPCPGA